MSDDDDAGSGRGTRPDEGADARAGPARGVMLLIVLSNTGYHLWETVGEARVEVLVRAVTSVVLDLRVYPMFAFLIGYGMVQIHRRRLAASAEPGEAVSVVRRARCLAGRLRPAARRSAAIDRRPRDVGTVHARPGRARALTARPDGPGLVRDRSRVPHHGAERPRRPGTHRGRPSGGGGCGHGDPPGRVDRRTAAGLRRDAHRRGGVLAFLLERAGVQGPAEVALRRLVDGRAPSRRPG